VLSVESSLARIGVVGVKCPNASANVAFTRPDIRDSVARCVVPKVGSVLHEHGTTRRAADRLIDHRTSRSTAPDER
jgi:hypothetical protein